MEAVGRITAEMRPRPRAGEGNLASDQGSGAMPVGAASAEAGGADSDRGEWGVGREKWGAVVEPRSKIPQQPGSQASRETWACQAVKPAGKSGPAGLTGRRTTPRQPGSQASQAVRLAGKSGPAGPGGRKENALAEKRKYL